MLHTSHPAIAAVMYAMLGAAVALVAVRLRRRGARPSGLEWPRPSEPVTRLDAHLASSSPSMRYTPVSSTALRRDVQARFENREAMRDLEILDRLLRDIRDLSGADEAIFWRWIEARQTLVPSAWSTEDEPRPVFFNMQAWGPIVRWSAEEAEMQLSGKVDGAPMLAAAPVLAPIQGGVYGVLTVSAYQGLRFDRDGARSWLPRFASQVEGLMQLFDLRRDYGRTMRQSEALLDAVQRLQGHRSAEALAQALCETARDVGSANVAGLVRWNGAERHGVLQAIAPSADIEPGFHVTVDSLVGRACTERMVLLLDDARSATSDTCPYGGLHRPIGSLAIHPIQSVDAVIGALVLEGNEPGQVSQHESRNIGLLAAVARGPLETVWEIEEVSRRARTDPLTGLANRRHFDEQLRRVIAETDRFGGSCSLILVDLDHFKAINDEHGHDAGDAVLRHVAQVLGDAVRTVDLCARHGREEIAVLLPQTVEAGASELAERLRQTLESRPCLHGGERIRVTASIGVATYPSPVPYGDWLVLAADKALYEAKGGGRNCVKVIQPTHVTPALYKAKG